MRRRKITTVVKVIIIVSIYLFSPGDAFTCYSEIRRLKMSFVLNTGCLSSVHVLSE